jgi:hypothetical protein
MSSNLQKRGFIVASFIIAFFLISQTAFAQTTTPDEPTITAGITPDSWLYGLDVAIDQISLLLTFDNGAKARKGLEIARERLLEVKEMVEENKLDAAERAQNEHANVLGTVTSAVGGIERANSTEELEEEIEIEMELEKHKEEIENVKGELKVKIEVEGVITPEQQALVDSILSSLENKTGEVEIEIENKEDKTKIKVEVETGRSGKEVEIEIERKIGLLEKRKERAEDRIEDAREEIEEVKEELIEENVTITDIAGLEQLLREAEAKLESAELAFAEQNYGEAFGQATAAKQLAKNAKKLIEKEEVTKVKAEVVGNVTQAKVKVKFMSTVTEREILASEILNKLKLGKETISNLLEIEIEEEKELKERLRAEVKIKEGISKVKTKFEFTLDTTDRDEIIDGIYDKLSALTIEDITNVLEIEVEEKEIEIEVKIEEDGAKVEIEIDEAEWKFILDTTNRDEIISMIVEKTGLTKQQIEKIIEFEIKEVEIEKETAKEKINETREKLMKLQEEGVNITDALERLDEVERKIEADILTEDPDDVLESIEKEAKGKKEKVECITDEDCKEGEVCVEGKCEKSEEQTNSER